AEHVVDAGGAVGGVLLRGLYRFGDGGEHDGAIVIQIHAGADGVEGTAANQRFQCALVDLARVHAGTEVENILEGAAFVAGGDDAFHRPFTEALDGAEAVDDVSLVHGETPA